MHIVQVQTIHSPAARAATQRNTEAQVYTRLSFLAGPTKSLAVTSVPGVFLLPTHQTHSDENSPKDELMHSD